MPSSFKLNISTSQLIQTIFFSSYKISSCCSEAEGLFPLTASVGLLIISDQLILLIQVERYKMAEN